MSKPKYKIDMQRAYEREKTIARAAEIMIRTNLYLTRSEAIGIIERQQEPYYFACEVIDLENWRVKTAAINRIQRESEEIEKFRATMQPTEEDLAKLMQMVTNAHCHCENTIAMIQLGGI